MRSSRWFISLVLCSVCSLEIVLADDLDVPSWRSYGMSSSEKSGNLHASETLQTVKGTKHAVEQRIVTRAHELIGTPYRWGGESKEEGFDCSGLLVYLYRSIANHELPRNTQSMLAQRHNKVGREELKPGDAVFFSGNGSTRSSHVGLYIGENRFIHAPSRGKSVRIDSMDNSYWQRNYTTARRFRG